MKLAQTPDPRVKTGYSKNGGARHIVDDWSCEMAKKRKAKLSLCGVEIEAGTFKNVEPLCQRCEQVVRKFEREMRRRSTLPPDSIILECLTMILNDSEPDMAKIIPFRFREAK